jgi:hypothetical protein
MPSLGCGLEALPGMPGAAGAFLPAVADF